MNRFALYIIIIICSIFAAGCSHTDAPAAPDTAYQLDDETILFAIGGSTDMEWSSEVVSRGARDDDDLESIPSDVPDILGVFGFNNRANASLGSQGGGEVFSNAPLYYGDGRAYQLIKDNLPWDLATNNWPYPDPRTWMSTVDPNSPTRYKFFLYSPYEPNEVEENVRVDFPSYSNFYRFVWKHLPCYTASNIMVAQNIKVYQSRRPGESNDVQKITMIQLQSRIRFKFCLGPTFSDLRRVRLRSMKVTDLRGETLELTVNFAEEESKEEGDPNLILPTYIATRNWTKEIGTNTAPEVQLVNEKEVGDYLELTAENRMKDGVEWFQPFASLYVFPDYDLLNVNIEVTYDVYDRKGQLLRENQKAKNTVKLTLYNSSTVQDATHKHVLKSGYYYDVKLRIEPNYLYALSDNDFLMEDEIGGHIVMTD